MLQADKSRRIMLISAEAIILLDWWLLKTRVVEGKVATNKGGLELGLHRAGISRMRIKKTYQVNTTTNDSYIVVSRPGEIHHRGKRKSQSTSPKRSGKFKGQKKT
jgi:hypothetical protein